MPSEKSSKNTTKKMNILLEIKDYDNVNQCFIMNDGTYFDILKLRCRDLLNADEDSIVNECYALLKWMKTFQYEYEIVGLNFPVNTTEQQSSVEHIMRRTENPQNAHYLNQKLNELKIIDNKMIEKQFYLFLFFDDIDTLTLERNKVLNQLGRVSLIESIERFYKELILFKINNKTRPISKERINEQYVMNNYQLSDEEKKENESLGYNKSLMESIGVIGNIDFSSNDRYTVTGTGYEACVYIHEYPESLDFHWLCILFNLQNAITTVHIKPENMREVKKNIQKSLGEQESRINMAQNSTDVRDARQEYAENLQTYEEIRSLGEIILGVGIRIYLSATTISELDTIVADTIDSLDSDNFKAAVFLNEQEFDFKAIYQPMSKQKNNVLCYRPGNPFKATTLAFGNPLHFSSLMDSHGDYLGLTKSTNGPVIWDPFAKTSRRKSYNGVVWGMMGSGKSTLLKKIEKSMVIRGNFVRGFDVSGEWIDLVLSQGGRMIALDGTAGKINHLEVLRTAETEETCYKLHLSKCSLIYRYLKPSATDDEIFEYENLLTMLYQSIGMIDDYGNPTNGRITGLPHNEYPTYSDLLNYLTQLLSDTDMEGLSKAEKAEAESQVAEFIKIKRTLQNVITTSGDIFDGHTTIENILESQVVFYDIRGLARMKETVFDAVMFSALSLAYDNLIQIGTIMKEKWELWESGDHENGLHWLDITRFMILVDEFHRIVNSHKVMAIEQILLYEREARKYFGGIWFASQSVNDSVPDEGDSYGVEQLKKVFELCQYKIVMQQDTPNIPKLKKLFKGEIPDAELDLVPRLETGECILNIQGDTNVLMSIFISDEEKEAFRGGA